jgi:Glucosamine-6-phosphate isomerases/6-phosphogluconolactonase
VNALLTAPPRRDVLDWTRVVFWFGDERCVPPDDETPPRRRSCNERGVRGYGATTCQVPPMIRRYVE